MSQDPQKIIKAAAKASCLPGSRPAVTRQELRSSI